MKISIITASYNYEQYITKCIESVIAQSHQDWELIIVDDYSKDSSVEIIKSFCEKDSRIKLICHTENKGLKETILTGISNTTGDWIAFLESDDVFQPENLAKKVKIIEKYPEIKLIFNKVEFLWDEKRAENKRNEFEKTQKNLSKLSFPRNMFYDFYLNNKILTFSSVMVEKEMLQSADFNVPVDAMLDWWLWINLSSKTEFYYIDEALTIWNLHPESYIKNYKKRISVPTQVIAYQNIYKKHPENKKLIVFIIYSFLLLFFTRGYKFLRKHIQRLSSK